MGDYLKACDDICNLWLKWGKYSWLVIERNYWNKGTEPQQSNEDFFCFIHRRRFIMTFLGASYCGNRRVFLSATGPTGITWPFSYLLRARGQRYRNTWKRMRTISLIMTKKYECKWWLRYTRHVPLLTFMMTLYGNNVWLSTCEGWPYSTCAKVMRGQNRVTYVQ